MADYYMDEKKIGILGAGGQADEAESFLRNDHSVKFRATNKEYINNDQENVIDIEEPNEDQRSTPVVAALGAPALRRVMIEQWSGDQYHSIISEHAVIDKTTRVGDGCIIAPRVVTTTNVEIGDHTLINVAATIQHNTTIGKFVTIGPGVHIAGNVEIGDGVFIGIGASISNNVHIAPGVVVGAGAVVVKNIDEENSIYVGVPAKKIGENKDWLNEI